MLRSPAYAVLVFAAAVPTGARAGPARDPAPATAVEVLLSSPSPPVLMLPAGGIEFRRVVLGWATSLTATITGDLLEMPVGAMRLSSRFGIRHDPMTGGLRAHRGIDIPDAAGAPVRAAAGGVVVFAGWSRGYGNLVEIDHGGGSETRYGHLAAIVVEVGAQLQQGAVIGAVGSTGRSTGPHLHFEVRQDGMAVDPLLRLGSAVATSSGVPSAPVRQSWSGFGQDTAALPQSHLR